MPTEREQCEERRRVPALIVALHLQVDGDRRGGEEQRDQIGAGAVRPEEQRERGRNGETRDHGLPATQQRRRTVTGEPDHARGCDRAGQSRERLVHDTERRRKQCDQPVREQRLVAVELAENARLEPVAGAEHLLAHEQPARFRPLQAAAQPDEQRRRREQQQRDVAPAQPRPPRIHHSGFHGCVSVREKNDPRGLHDQNIMKFGSAHARIDERAAIGPPPGATVRSAGRRRGRSARSRST